MKIKSGFLLRDVGANHVVVPVGAVDFDGMITLNETGVLLWKKLEKGTDQKELVQALLREYQVDANVAETDVFAFLTKLKDAGLLDE